MNNRLKAIVVIVILVVVLLPVTVKLARSDQSVSGAVNPAGRPAFVDDPGIVGKWVSIDFVQRIEDFRPGEKQWPGGLFLKDLEFKTGGRTSGPWEWSKGVLWHPGDQTLAKYEIKAMAGSKYLFMEWMSGDVTIRGQKPCYYVLKPENQLTAEERQVLSKSNEKKAPEFVDDPAVVGKWASVDFVKAIQDFKPGQRVWQGDLYLKGLECRPGGGTSGPWQWSKGVLWHPGDQTLAKYEIKDLAGSRYLFMEWMSGDVTIRGEKPRYYVLKSEGL